MALVETHCKICHSSNVSTVNAPFQASETTLQYHNEEYEFTKVYPKNYCVGDIGLVCFGENRAWNFFNSFNNALFICGTKQLLNLFLFPKSSRKHDNFLVTLYDQFLTQWNKKSKAKKRLFASLKNSQTFQGKDELKCWIRLRNLNETTSSNVFLRQPSITRSDIHSNGDETLKNFTSMNVTEYVSLLHDNIEFSERDIQNQVCVVDFQLIWYTLDYVEPMESFYHIVFLPFKSDSNWDSIYHPLFSDTQNYFSRYFGENCHTKLLYLVDGKDPAVTTNLLKHSHQFKDIKNFPIKNTCFVKTMLDLYRKEVKKLKQQNETLKYDQEKKDNEYSRQLSDLQNTNDHLKVQLDTVTNELSELKNDHLELVEFQKNFVQGNTEQQTTQLKHQAETSQVESEQLRLEIEQFQKDSKEQISALESQVLKIERLLLYEKKLNADLKEKYNLLKAESDNVNEEFTSLKLNYNILLSQYQKKTKSSDAAGRKLQVDLSEKSDEIDFKNSEMKLQCKMFIDEIKEILKKVGGDTLKLEEVNLDDELKVLKRALHLHICQLNESIESLLGKVSNYKSTISSNQQRLAASSTENSIVKVENDEKNEKIIELEKFIHRVSNEYKLRLEQYITDVKSYLEGQDEGKDAEELTCLVDSFKESFEKQSQVKDREIKDLQEKVKKLECGYRQYVISYRLHMNECMKESSYLDSDLHQDVATVHQQENFLVKENFDLQKKVKEMGSLIKDLQGEVEGYRKMKFTTSKFNEPPLIPVPSYDSCSNYSSRQHFLERERVDLLTRCLLAEERMKSQEMRLDEVKLRWANEVEQLYNRLSQYERFVPVNENEYLMYDGHFLPPIEPPPNTMAYKQKHGC